MDLPKHGRVSGEKEIGGCIRNEDGSKPITIFRGITIQSPAISVYHPGPRVLTHSHIYIFIFNLVDLHGVYIEHNWEHHHGLVIHLDIVNKIVLNIYWANKNRIITIDIVQRDSKGTCQTVLCCFNGTWK